jgi:hypothetical protein
MSRDAIVEWLRGDRNYDRGRQLYEELGDDVFLKRLFAMGSTVFNREKLEATLRKMVHGTGDGAAGPKEVMPGKVKYQEPTNKEFEQLPEDVRKLKKEGDLLFKEMSHLHSRLMDMKDEERGAAALRILALAKELRSIWSKLDHYAEHGKLPDAVKVEVKAMSVAEAMVRRNTLRSYLSRNPDSVKAEKWKAELEGCEKIIKST